MLKWFLTILMVTLCISCKTQEPQSQTNYAVDKNGNYIMQNLVPGNGFVDLRGVMPTFENNGFYNLSGTVINNSGKRQFSISGYASMNAEKSGYSLNIGGIDISSFIDLSKKSK